MDLLPATPSDFRSTSYWDSFFRKRADRLFDWYGEYADLCGVLHRYAKPAQNILHVGCGTSRLSEDLHDVGYRRLTNIDLSEVAIERMCERNRSARPDLKFRVMDATKMEFDDSIFDVVLDKGTLDAMMGGSDVESDVVTKAFSEFRRVLKAGGRYVCFSLAQGNVLDTLMRHFGGGGDWFVRVHRVEIVSSEDGQGMPVFAFVMTKVKEAPFKIFEICHGCDDAPKRLDTADALVAKVHEMQRFGLMKRELTSLSPGRDLPVSLWQKSKEGDSLRYLLHVVDNKSKSSNGKFAVFIVPQGREIEWFFASEEGRLQLAATAGYSRLAIAILTRDQTYDSLDVVKAELGKEVTALAPKDISPTAQIPFLSLGDDVSCRTIRHRGCSERSGEFVVEDVQHEDSSFFRRLIFLSAPSVVQSEARLIQKSLPRRKEEKKKRNKKKKQTAPPSCDLKVDVTYLAPYHQKITTSIAWIKSLKTNDDISLLIIGLGGGGLISYLSYIFPKVHMTVVELDGSFVEVAKNWFGFEETDSIRIVIGDGLDYIKETQENAFDLIIYDMDSKEISEGLTAPPQPFIQIEILRKVFAALKPNGVLSMNFVCRSASIRKSTLKNFQSAGYLTVFSAPNIGEVNETFFAPKIDDAKFEPQSATWLRDNVRYLDDIIRKKDPNGGNMTSTLKEVKHVPYD